MGVKVKLCGISNAADARAAAGDRCFKKLCERFGEEFPCCTNANEY